MAMLKPNSKITPRPQIKAVQQPIPRQVILPQKTQPFVNPAKLTRNQKPVLKNIAQPEAIQQTKSQAIPQSDMQSLFARMQSQFTNSTNPLYSSPQIAAPTQAPVNFESYGFDKELVNYLNNQRQMSAMDAGVSYNYDPATQTFTGQTMGGPVTKTLAEIQAESQNYTNRPTFNPNNPAVVTQAGVMQNPPTSVQGGFGQPFGFNNIAPTFAQNTANNQMYGEQLPLGANPMSNMVGMPQFNQQPIYQQLGMQPQQGFDAMPNYNQQGLGSVAMGKLRAAPLGTGGAGMPYMGGMDGGPNYANSGSPIGGNPQAQPFGQTMAQTGFVPVGGYNPQNTSNGSFGAIQQPTGGFGNIGSLLGMG